MATAYCDINKRRTKFRSFTNTRRYFFWIVRRYYFIFTFNIQKNERFNFFLKVNCMYCGLILRSKHLRVLGNCPCHQSVSSYSTVQRWKSRSRPYRFLLYLFFNISRLRLHTFSNLNQVPFQSNLIYFQKKNSLKWLWSYCRNVSMATYILYIYLHNFFINRSINYRITNFVIIDKSVVIFLNKYQQLIEW